MVDISVEEMRRRQGVRREKEMVAEAKKKYNKEQRKIKKERIRKEFAETGAGFRKLTLKIMPKQKKQISQEQKLKNKLSEMKLRTQRPSRRIKPQRPQPVSYDNESEMILRQEQEYYTQLEKRRQRKKVSRDFIRRKLAQKRMEMMRRQQFQKETNLLNAHKNMLSHKENSFDILNVENSILNTKNNNIMKQREDSINILRPRRHILATRESGNDLKFF